MEMKGSQTVAATVERTWHGLNDPDTLKACIPGCEALEPAGENSWTVVMNLKIGPVGARFKGKLLLSNVQAPNSYTIQFEGQGGAAGFGKGSADVKLSPADGGTLLEYGVNAQIGGRIAQVGARLVDAAAKKMADDFFARFNKVIAEGGAAAAAQAAAPAEPAAPSRPAVSPALSDASAAEAAAVSPSLDVVMPPAAAAAPLTPPAPAAPMAQSPAAASAAPIPAPAPAVPPQAAPAPAQAAAMPAQAAAAPAQAGPAPAPASAATPPTSRKPAWIWWLLAIIVLFVVYWMLRG